MSRTKQAPEQPASSVTVAESIREVLRGRHVCPYCGLQTQNNAEPCTRCTMEDTPATRQATKSRIGPWYVLQSRNPAAPGMKYATLLSLINRGQVTAKSIVRGPTTHQLWRFAAHVRGISREFGLCYSCGGSIEKATILCPHCERPQDAPAEPDQLLEPRSQPSAPAPMEMPHSHVSRVRELNRSRLLGEQGGQTLPAPRGRQEMARRADGSIVSAMELAAALQEGHGESPARRVWPWRLLRVVGLFIVVLGTVGAGVLILKPELREPTNRFLSNTWSTIEAKVSSVEWPTVRTTGGSAPTATVATPTPAPAPAPMSKPIVSEPELHRTAAIEPLVTGVDPSRPLLVPDSSSAPSKVVEAPVPLAPPPTAVAPQQPVQQEVSPAPAQPSALAADPLTRSRQLWIQAKDAEQLSKYAEAVRIYEQIKQLPPDVRSPALEINLFQARQRAGQTSAQ